MLPTICPSPLMFTAFLIVSGVIYLMYVKTKQELRCNEKCKESELKTACNQHCQGQTPKDHWWESNFLSGHYVYSLPHNTATDLCLQLDSTHSSPYTTATSAAQLFPQSVLLVLTCFGYFATTSPLLMLMNYRYRQYVKEILCCALDSQDGRKHPIQQLQIGHDGLPMLQPTSPQKIKMFFLVLITNPLVT